MLKTYAGLALLLLARRLAAGRPSGAGRAGLAEPVARRYLVHPNAVGMVALVTAVAQQHVLGVLGDATDLAGLKAVLDVR